MPTPTMLNVACFVAMGTKIATSTREAMPSNTAEVIIPVTAGVVLKPSVLKLTRVRETAVAVMVNPQSRAMLWLPQNHNVAKYAIEKGAIAPNKAIPQLRLILAIKLSVFSSKPRANMINMMPSSATLSMNAGISSGSHPRLTIAAPKNRYHSTGVSRVLCAAKAAAKTQHQIITRM